MISIMRAIIVILAVIAATIATADESTYQPAKVIYDVSESDPRQLENILDRISLLQNIYGSDPFEASIVVVLHEGVIPLFSLSRQSEFSELMVRAESLTAAEVIDFRMCRASAQIQGYGDEDFPEFVSMVPMADAEIVHLQNEGYAYIR